MMHCQSRGDQTIALNGHSCQTIGGQTITLNGHSHLKSPQRCNRIHEDGEPSLNKGDT